MALFKKRKNPEDYDIGIDQSGVTADLRTDKNSQIVKYEGSNELLFEKFEFTQLRYDAKIVVPATHYAIIMNDGMLLDVKEDGGRYDLFEKSKGLFSEKKKDETVTVDVVYISNTARLRVVWGTRTKFDFRDPETGVPLKVGANGEFEVKVKSPRKFYLELVGADKQFTIDKLKERLSMQMLSYVEPGIAKTMREKNLTYDRMAEYKRDISDAIKPQLDQLFQDNFGLTICSFTIATILLEDEDIKAIETERKRLLDKKENEEDIKKATSELERLDDKEYAREKERRDQANEQVSQYYDAVKAVGHFNGEGVNQDTLKCPDCGYTLSPKAKFCPNCGKKIVQNTNHVCPQCGLKVDENAKFCPNCGKKL